MSAVGSWSRIVVGVGVRVGVEALDKVRIGVAKFEPTLQPWFNLWTELITRPWIYVCLFLIYKV